jgi:hypothetical protein
VFIRTHSWRKFFRVHSCVFVAKIFSCSFVPIRDGKPFVSIRVHSWQKIIRVHPCVFVAKIFSCSFVPIRDKIIRVHSCVFVAIKYFVFFRGKKAKATPVPYAIGKGTKTQSITKKFQNSFSCSFVPIRGKKSFVSIRVDSWQ